MMLRLFVLYLSLAIPYLTTAQITITSDNFPRPGDTLLTAVDNLPYQIQLSAPGGDQVWDFTSLKAPYIRQRVVRPASEGKQSSFFDDAQLVVHLEENLEAYYKITADAVELVGCYGIDPLQLGLDLLTRFHQPMVSRRAPMNYFDVNEQEVKLAVPFSTDGLPSSVMMRFPITPDSLRLRMTINRSDIVDAWGTLTIPSGNYEVLREKRMEIRQVSLDAKIGTSDWQDISNTLTAGQSIGKDTVLSYQFFSKKLVEPVAVLYVDPNSERITRAEYKSVGFSQLVHDLDAAQAGIYAFPNPAIQDVRFEFSNLIPGKYDLKIFNILGLEVWSKRYKINGNKTEKIDLSTLDKGTYLYSLVDQRGKTLATKRLIIVRP